MKNLSVTKITYNWRYSTDPDYGEEYDTFEVGKDGVSKIEVGPIYCEVFFEDGSVQLIYNPNLIFLEPTQS